MDQRVNRPAFYERRVWAMLLVFALVALVILAIGSYAFNWTWTGFKGNTLWDWLQLLILPLVLTSITLWFSAHQKWRSEWTVLLIFLGVVFIALVVGSYVFKWTWTGFKGNTLWDWLKLLLLPVVLTGATVWININQTSLSEIIAKPQEQNAFTTTRDQQKQAPREAKPRKSV